MILVSVDACFLPSDIAELVYMHGGVEGGLQTDACLGVGGGRGGPWRRTLDR